MLQKDVIRTHTYNGTIRQGNTQAFPYTWLSWVSRKLLIRTEIDFEQHRHNTPPFNRRRPCLPLF